MASAEELAEERRLRAELAAHELRLAGQPFDAAWAQAARSLGFWAGKHGRHSEAVQLNREALEVERKLHSPGSNEIVYPLYSLAGSLINAGEYGEAAAVASEAVAVMRSTIGFDHAATVAVRVMLGTALVGQRRLDEALPLMREVLSCCDRRALLNLEGDSVTPAQRDKYTDESACLVGECYVGLGQPAAAVPLFRRALQLRTRLYGPSDPDTMDAQEKLDECLQARQELLKKQERKKSKGKGKKKGKQAARGQAAAAAGGTRGAGSGSAGASSSTHRTDGASTSGSTGTPAPRVTSQYKGVSWNSSCSKWVAVLWDRKLECTRHIGSFESEEDAARAYDREAIETLGTEVELNFRESLIDYLASTGGSSTGASSSTHGTDGASTSGSAATAAAAKPAATAPAAAAGPGPGSADAQQALQGLAGLSLGVGGVCGGGPSSSADQAGGGTAGSSKAPRVHTCLACGRTATGLKKCSRCRAVYFCNEACRDKAWKAHKKECHAPA